MTFETTQRDDHHELVDQVDPGPWMDLLLQILEHAVRLVEAQTAIKQAMEELEAAGIYPAVPTPFWDRDPNGQPRYMKLSFPRGALDNGRKIYIGCRESKITEAKQKIARTQRFEALGEERTRLERFLRMTRADLDRVARQVGSYRVPDDLGLDLAGGQASAGPKEWIRTRPRVGYEL